MSTAETTAARRVCVGFDGTAVTPELRALLARGVEAVILFSRNAEDRDQVRDLIRAIQDAAPHPVLVCVDQEGGDVQRFRKGFTELPSLRTIGASETEALDLARQTGETLARELTSVGIGLDLAPVMDVDTNPDNPVIGARSFGEHPSLVARYGLEMIRAMQYPGPDETPLAACAKHFPGHGDTILDSHEALPRLAHDVDRLFQVELFPFRAAVRARVAAIMTAHIVIEAFDPDRPATLSPAVVDDFLKDGLGFDGLVISDDLEMKAIADRMTIGSAAVEAVRAGVDLVLCCHTPARQHEAIDAIAAAIDGAAIDAARVADADRRWAALRSRFRTADQLVQ